MSEWVWIKNEAVNDIPGRIPADVLPAWEARGWVECPEPTDDVEVDAPAPPEELPDAPAPAPKPSLRGQNEEK